MLQLILLCYDIMCGGQIRVHRRFGESTTMLYCVGQEQEHIPLKGWQPPIRPLPGVTFKSTTKFIFTAMNTSDLNTNNGDNSALHTQ